MADFGQQQLEALVAVLRKKKPTINFDLECERELIQLFNRQNHKMIIDIIQSLVNIAKAPNACEKIEDLQMSTVRLFKQDTSNIQLRIVFELFENSDSICMRKVDYVEKYHAKDVAAD